MRVSRDLFAEEGYAPVSLETIVSACGLTKGALYHHFSCKAELFEAVLEEEARRLSQEVAAALEKSQDAWSGARAGVRTFLRASQEPAVQRIMFVDGPSVLGWQRVREIESPHGLSLLRNVLGALVKAGEIPRSGDTNVLAHLLLGALTEGALMIARGEDARTVEKEVLRLVEGLAKRPHSS